MNTDLFSQITEATQPKQEPKSVIKADVKAKVGVTVKSQGKETEIKSEQKVIEQKLYDKDPPRIWIDYGFTKNLGNYESAKISIGLSLPVGPGLSEQTSKEIQQTQEEGMKLLEKMLEKELLGIEQWLKQKRESEPKSIF